MQIKISQQKGFTLIELMISIGIFAMMTVLMLTKFGNFNQGILLSNLAYDVALTIRNAQSYGLNVKSADRASSDFNYPYGAHFTTSAVGQENTKFRFFADQDSNGVYSLSVDDAPIGAPPNATVFTTITNIKRGTIISNLCINTCTGSDIVNTLDIVFRRPDPNAIINGNTTNTYAKITLKATDGTKKNIEVRSTGQIQVTN